MFKYCVVGKKLLGYIVLTMRPRNFSPNALSLNIFQRFATTIYEISGLKLFLTFAVVLSLAIMPVFTSFAKATRSPPTSPTTLKNFVTGIEGDVLKNVENRLNAQQEPYQGRLNTKAIKHLYGESLKQIKEALAPYGYLKPHIQSALLHRGPNWQAHYHITPGPVLKITKLTLIVKGMGRSDPSYKKLIQHFPIKQGQPFNAKKYKKAKQKLYDLAIERGYFDAIMEKNLIKIDKRSYHCYITIIFNTGPRFRFGQVYFNKTPFAQGFLHRFIPFKTGEYFHDDAVQNLHDNLESGSYFQNVTVNPKPDKANKHHAVPINIKLTPRKAKRYSFGVGYGTDTGPRGSFGIHWRRVTPAGHQLNTDVQASMIQQTLNGSYIIPGRNPVHDQYQINVASERFNDQSSGQYYHTNKIALSYITQVWGWRPTFSLNMIGEHYRNFDEKKEFTLLFMPSFLLSRTKSDDTLKPTKGYSLSFLAQGSLKRVLSNINFYQLRVDGKWLRSLTRNQRVFLQGTIGYTGIRNLNDLPLSLQFYAGGAHSVRGYSYREIINGRYITVGSAELQQRLFGNFYVLGFYDVGSVNNKILHKIKQGVGSGLMWLSPVGAIKLTAAKPLNPANKNKNNIWMIQFTMGPEL